MVDVGRLPLAERIAIARLTGIAIRHGSGQGEGEGDPTAELQAVSADPRLLGIAAGTYSVVPNPHERQAAELLHQAGADGQVAVEHAVQVRYWLGLPTSKDQPR